MVVIYDGEGKIISVRNSEEWKPKGVPYLITEQKEGYLLKGVNVSKANPEPIWEKNQKEETVQEVLADVREQVALIAGAVDMLLFPEEVNPDA